MGVFKKANRWYIDYYLPDGKRRREVASIPGVDPFKVTRQEALKALSRPLALVLTARRFFPNHTLAYREIQI
jgi:hypothetical protein